MVSSVSAAQMVAASNSSNSSQNAAAQAKAAAATVAPAKAVPTMAELDAKAFLLRQQIGAALYDRSFTFNEGARMMKRQDRIAAYAMDIQSKEGGPTDKELRRLGRMLDRAGTRVAELSNNDRGANLAPVEAIDGYDLDIVQENLTRRIENGIEDGSLTADEAKALIEIQNFLAGIETKLRESDGKLTAGEQKQMLDEYRKLADQVVALRHNAVGVSAGSFDYGDSIDKRQAALEKALEAGIKAGSLTAEEAEIVRQEFATANELEVELRADGRVDWRDSVKMSTALNNAEIALYDLQRNKAGVQLAEQFVDVKYVDMRQAQQLESVSRGISNKSLTDVEAVELLQNQQRIQNQEDRLVDGGLSRSEYLRLQNAMNDFALRNQELQANSDRWTGLLPPVVTLPPAGGNGNAGGSGGAGGSGNTGGSGSTGGAGGTGSTGGSGSTGGAGGTGGSGGSTGAGGSGNAGGPSGTGGAGSTGGSGGNAPAVVDTTNPADKPSPPVAEAETPQSAPQQEEIAPALGQVENVRDIFGELMSAVMRRLDGETRGFHEAAIERARERIEEMRRVDDKRADKRPEQRAASVETGSGNAADKTDRPAFVETGFKVYDKVKSAGTPAEGGSVAKVA